MDVRCRTALADAPDEQLSQPWRFSFGEQMISHDSRTRASVNVLQPYVHHMAQFGLYSGEGSAGPSAYGPSADEQWSLKRSAKRTVRASL